MRATPTEHDRSSRAWKSGRSTELCDAAVVTARPPAGRSDAIAMFSAIVAFSANATREEPPGTLSKREIASRARKSAIEASMAGPWDPRPGPPNDVSAAPTASMTACGFSSVVAALSK